MNRQEKMFNFEAYVEELKGKYGETGYLKIHSLSQSDKLPFTGTATLLLCCYVLCYLVFVAYS